MANAWKQERPSSLFSPQKFLFILPVSLLLLFLLFKSSNPTPNLSIPSVKTSNFIPSSPIVPFDCFKCRQASRVFANLVEGVKYPFLYSLADLGTPDKPHKNIQRMLKGKRFRKPDISVSVQEVLERMRSLGREGVFVDVGANVGMATFAAAAVGFRVLAFEPVFENLQRICDGVFLNRAGSLVTLFAAAASDQLGNITIYKLEGRLDNTAISKEGARLAFQSNKAIAMDVKGIPLDEVIPESVPVILLKIDVQGWEHHVLKGATKLLTRKGSEAPYIIYEEDERLLQASNSSAREIREFLSSVGYNHCTQRGTDAHCSKG
ncbi:uncharacterized protein [Aristolochia californica]|uniref:uncharacterized protein n=1 Tax=Aristolochia californica TaxID=171875 RepID=UPI0035D80003